MAETFIDDLEAVVDEVAQWGADEVVAVINALAPDGRPFGAVKKDIEQQLTEYRLLRNDVNAWMVWISQKATELTGTLMQASIDPDTINAVNPVNIAIL